MSEESIDQALRALNHAQALFLLTRNPYWVCVAARISKDMRWAAPDWAATSLFDAAAVALDVHHDIGKPLSIDAAIGLKTKRGGTPASKRAHLDSMERIVFADIRVLHRCFKISTNQACEFVYNEPDFQFARDIEDGLSECPIDPSKYPDVGITPQQWKEFNEQGLESDRKLLEVRLENAVVRAKVAARQWWTVTTGDRLGYTVDHLVEKYHNAGDRRHSRLSSMDEERRDFAFGMSLREARGVRLSGLNSIPEAVVRNPLRDVAARPKFVAFVGRCKEILGPNA